MTYPYNPLALSSVFALAVAFLPLPSPAQVTGDGTLGTLVNGAPTDSCTGFCVITEGSTRGSNLFHSFRQFSLPNGDFAGFVTNPAIQNVIVRVTRQGAEFRSDINGTIATTDPTLTSVIPTNFFLLNPNGIVFGPNAQIFVGGSFLATTAERMQFQDGTVLSTPDPAPLLTVSVPIGLQMGQTPGEIRSSLRVGVGINSLFTDFALVGGDVTLDNSVIQSPGQRVELSGMGENGSMGLRLNSHRLSFDLVAGTPHRDITLTNGSSIDVAASNGGGEVVVTGGNIFLDGGFIFAGILSGIDNAITNQAGNITINAAVTLQLTQRSTIGNLVDANAIGQGGNLRITASDIRLRDGSAIAALTSGNGNAGNVQVTANTITLDNLSGIASEVGITGTGRGGDIAIETGSLTLTNGAVVSASTLGAGNAGNMQVIANTIFLDGTSPDGQFASGIASQVASTATGSGGNVTVQTGSLTATNGAGISASTAGNGNAGNVRVIANTIFLNGTTPNGQAGGIASQVAPTGSGRGGDIIVETGSLTAANGAGVSASTFGTGNGGNVQITANTISLDGTSPNGQAGSGINSGVGSTGSGRGGAITVETGSLIVTNGAGITASTFGNGNGGNVQVTANTITLDGLAPSGQFGSGIGSQVAPTATGSGGNVTVQTGSLTATNGAAISTNTFGNGSGGNVRVTANTIALDGTSPNGQFTSGISSGVERTGNGRGGDVTVQTGYLTVTNGAVVSANTFGNGNGGNVRVTANTIALDGTSSNGQFGSGIASQVASTGSGQGGDVTVEADSLTVTNGAAISSSAFGDGSAGNLDITARTIRLNGGNIIAFAFSGDGANITLDVGKLLLLLNGSQISTSAGLAGTGGDGGNITINAPRGFIVGVKSENSDITANAFTGSGGRVNITAQGIYGLQFRPQLTPFSDITASSTFGISGTVILDTPDIDPSRGLQELPLDLVDPSRQIVQTCPRGAGSRELGTFVVTGRGSLPPNPTDLFPGSLSAKPLATLDDFTPQPISHQPPTAELKSAVPASIAEAQRIVKTTNGEIFLVADAPASAVLGSPAILDCP